MKISVMCFVCFLAITTVHCQKEVMQKSPLSGTWVEISMKTDTIEFLPEYESTNPILWLKRGKNNHNLPKEYSGPYTYELHENTISLNWFLSSNSGYHAYYFELAQDRKEFKIVNFFDKPYENKDTLVFQLIK